MSQQESNEIVHCVDCSIGVYKKDAHSIVGIGHNEGDRLCHACYNKTIEKNEYILCAECQHSISVQKAFYNEGSAYCIKCFNQTVFKEFKVNDLITMKLMGNKTHIFLKDKKISQCMFLLMNIPTEEAEDEECINMDEFGNKYSRGLEQDRDKYDISVETEFWGHCSNIQAWAENDYNPNMLHSSLAVPLLTVLCSENRKIFDALLYHLDEMWSLYKTPERRSFVFHKFGNVINKARQIHNIEYYELQESLFFRTISPTPA